MSGARDYDEEGLDHESRRYAYGFDWVIRDFLLRRWAPFIRSGPALEVGAFEGDMTQQILPFVDSLCVLEASPRLCLLLQQKFGDAITITGSTIEEAEYPAKFNSIFLVHTLEHVDDPVLALKQISRWLTADGLLFVAVPNALALSRQIAVRMGIVDFSTAVTPGELAHGHRRTYMRDTLRHDAVRAGLTVIDSGGVLVKPLSNSQFDAVLEAGILSAEYLRACDALTDTYPDLAASIFVICKKAQ